MKIRSLICSLVALSSAQALAISQGGLVTPTSVIITVQKIYLIDGEDHTILLWDGNKEIEFTRSGESFAVINIDDILMPAGRYKGVRLDFLYYSKVKLDGVKFYGAAGDSFAAGDTLYTTAGGSALTANAATKVVGTAQYVSGVGPANSTGIPDASVDTTFSYFTQTQCVAPAAEQCKAGDLWAKEGDSKAPSVNVMYDIFQSIRIDGDDGTITRAPQKPFGVLGEPGAAIHLVSVAPGNSGSSNVTAIFGNEKELLSAAAYEGGSTSYGIGSNSSLVTVYLSGTYCRFF
jgi:hypothetical protein